MHDMTQYGVKLKYLNIIDEYSRELISVKVRKTIKANDVIDILEEAMAEKGIPDCIRSDNGPEFIANSLQEWADKKGWRPIYITAGHPWENGFVESFNGKFVKNV